MHGGTSMMGCDYANHSHVISCLRVSNEHIGLLGNSPGYLRSLNNVGSVTKAALGYECYLWEAPSCTAVQQFGDLV